MALDAKDLGLDLRPIASLIPHEETIPGHSEKLGEQILKEGVQKDPLIVEREHGVVLDGMHRLSAFKSLGAEYVVCHPVDYASKSILLHGWVRVLRVGRLDLAAQMLENMGVSKKVSLSEVFGLIESRSCSVAAIGSSGCFVTGGPGSDASRGFEIVRRVDSAARVLGWAESFVAEDEIDLALEDPMNIALVLPRFGKQDILSAAIGKKLLPYKTSMHSIDPRPVGVYFPLGSLMTRNPPKEELSKIIEGARPTILPSGSTYEGRTYKERLVLVRER